jgi:hypothetical protein
MIKVDSGKQQEVANEMSEAERRLASLALDRLRKDGVLGVRQHETLRRTLAFAGDALGWDLLPGSTKDRVKAVKKDMARLTEAGAEQLNRDITTLLAQKKKEIVVLRKVAATVRDLAKSAKTTYPTEVEVSFTQRSALGSYVTKTETLALNDATEALRIADELTNREESRAKARDQMVEELKERRRQLGAMKRDLPSFVESSHELVTELLALAS